MPVKLFPEINPTIFEEHVKLSLIVNPVANMSFKKADICCLGFDSFSYSLFCCIVGTSNRLNDKMKAGYENITVARHLGLPDLEMLQFVHSQITPGRLLS